MQNLTIELTSYRNSPRFQKNSSYRKLPVTQPTPYLGKTSAPYTRYTRFDQYRPKLMPPRHRGDTFRPADGASWRWTPSSVFGGSIGGNDILTKLLADRQTDRQAIRMLRVASLRSRKTNWSSTSSNQLKWSCTYYIALHFQNDARNTEHLHLSTYKYVVLYRYMLRKLR